MHFGIDFGSKKAGTTAVCFDFNNKIHIVQSEKKKDADSFISSLILEYKPNFIMIDAPLSLPGAFYGKGSNFHFRECDVKTKAMSPMFLGGLTARAIALKYAHSDFKFCETYPSYLMKELFENGDFYEKKKKISGKALSKIQTMLPIPLQVKPLNWHQFDACLAWLSGYRILKKTCLEIGKKEEGIIII